LVLLTVGIKLDEHGILHQNAAVTFALFVPMSYNLICVKLVHEELKTLGLDERVFNQKQILNLIDY